MTTCERLDQWLDEGRPGHEAALEAHAAGCDRCRKALAAAIELEAALRMEPAGEAPAWLADAVMARVATAGPRLAGGEEVAGAHGTAGWLRAFLGPWTVAGVAGLVAAGNVRAPLTRSIEQLTAALAGAATSPEVPSDLDRALRLWVEASASLSPSAQLGLALLAAGLGAVVALPLARWSEGLAGLRASR